MGNCVGQDIETENPELIEVETAKIKANKKEDPLFIFIKSVIPKEYLSNDFSKFYRIKKSMKCEQHLFYDYYYIEKKNSGQLFMGKIIKRDKIIEIGIDFFKDIFSNEIKNITVITHPHTERLIRVFLPQIETIDKDTKKDFKIIILTNYVSQLSLLDEINEHIRDKKRFTENEIYQVARTLLVTSYTFKNKNIVYRNISPDNIYFIKERNFKTLSIRNFYFSTTLEKTQKIKGVYGGLWYMAPEMLKDVKYDYKVDIWAIGVILYMMLTLENPFVQCDTRGKMLNLLNNDKIFKLDEESRLIFNVSRQLITFIKKLLKISPSLREPCEVLLEDDFFKKISEEENMLPMKMIEQMINYNNAFLDRMKDNILENESSKILHALVFYIIYCFKNFFFDMNESMKINDLYSLIDKDNDGYISLNEIEYTLKKHVDSNKKNYIERYKELINIILFSNDYIREFMSLKNENKITYEMFLVANKILMLAKKREDNPEYVSTLVRYFFDEVDLDQNGTIDFTELDLFIHNRKENFLIDSEKLRIEIEKAKEDNQIGIDLTKADAKDIEDLISYNIIHKEIK